MSDATGDATVPAHRRPSACSVCNIALPATATTDICDECDDPARQPYEPPADRPLYVVHDGKARREDARLCPYCNEALLYTDDQRDGYHTSVRACVTAHRKTPHYRGETA